MAVYNLDTKGLNCPLPVLRARKTLKELRPGDLLDIEATDPGAVRDFPAFCEATGHRLVTSDVRDGVYRFTIEKSG